MAATWVGVSETYIRLALTFDGGKRELILRGLDTASFTPLLTTVRPLLALPAPTPAITDTQLIETARQVGAERMLTAAILADTV
jgi:hypothetical protein